VVLVVLVAALAFGGCTDGASNPGGTGVPGMDEVDDEGYLDTSLPADLESQFTAAPNPNAGGPGAPAPGDPDPDAVPPTVDP
jgi:hypothetical protein